jgi:hypothetical protein
MKEITKDCKTEALSDRAWIEDNEGLSDSR